MKVEQPWRSPSLTYEEQLTRFLISCIMSIKHFNQLDIYAFHSWVTPSCFWAKPSYPKYSDIGITLYPGLTVRTLSLLVAKYHSGTWHTRQVHAACRFLSVQSYCAFDSLVGREMSSDDSAQLTEKIRHIWVYALVRIAPKHLHYVE